MSRESKIMIGILVLIVGGMVSLFFLGGGNSATPPTAVDTSKLVHDDSHATGTGSVTLVEFGDFQCPACGNAEPWVEQARQDFEGKVKFVFRNFPLSNIHPNALAAAHAAESAGAQGKYWEMHDKLYAVQKDWATLADPSAKFAEYATAVGVADLEKFKGDVASKVNAGRIEADIKDGNDVGVDATPTFFINGVKQSGISSYDDLKKALEDAK